MKYLLNEDQIDIPDGVQVQLKGRDVQVKGKHGTINKSFKHQSFDLKKIKGKQTKHKLRLRMWLAKKKQSAVIGSICSQISNMITGVTDGYKFKMVLAYAHFPIIINVLEDGKVLNFQQGNINQKLFGNKDESQSGLFTWSNCDEKGGREKYFNSMWNRFDECFSYLCCNPSECENSSQGSPIIFGRYLRELEKVEIFRLKLFKQLQFKWNILEVRFPFKYCNGNKNVQQQMVDWPGLLKFSLSKTQQNATFKEMKPEDKKWLQMALEDYSNAQTKRINELLQIISCKQNHKHHQLIYKSLQELQQLLETLDKGEYLYMIGGHYPLFDIIMNHQYSLSKLKALDIFCFCNQNSAQIQQISFQSLGFQFVNRITKSEEIKLKEGFLSGLSNMIRGQCLQIKRRFIDIQGIELLNKLIEQNASQKITRKALMILTDLLFYDNRLHYTYNDLSKFSNTTGLKGKTKSLSQDINQQHLKSNELQCNEKYKGTVMNKLKQLKLLDRVQEFDKKLKG